MGGLNFEEKHLQIAFWYELNKAKIGHIRKISLKASYKNIPIKPAISYIVFKILRLL